MSSQYLTCDEECKKCLIYSMCDITSYAGSHSDLVVGKPWRKLLPVFSTPEVYNHTYALPNSVVPQRVQTTEFASVTGTGEYLRWTGSETSITGLSHVSLTNDKMIRLGSVQITYKVEWELKALRNANTSKANTSKANTSYSPITVVVPERENITIGHEPWDIRGNRICIDVPTRKGETTRGSFVIPGQYWSFVISAPDANVEMKMSITALAELLYLPDVYAAPAEFSVKACDRAVLAYTNVSGRDHEVTRIPSAELASLSRIVQWVYKQKTYFNINKSIPITLTTKPVPNSKTRTLITFSSSFECKVGECDTLNKKKYNPFNAVASNKSFIPVDVEGSVDTGNRICGYFYARPVVTRVQYTSVYKPITASVGDNFFSLAPGTYQVKYSVIEGGSSNDAASFGEGISWDNMKGYTSALDSSSYPGFTGGMQNCVGEKNSSFNCILYENNAVKVMYEPKYSVVLNNTTEYPYDDFGEVNVMMQWGTKSITNSTLPPTFSTPQLPVAPPITPVDPNFAKQFLFIINVPICCGVPEYYIDLSSCISYYSSQQLNTALEQSEATHCALSNFSVEMEFFKCDLL